MARCARCNKFMLIKTQTGYCNDCCNAVILEDKRRREAEERERKAEEERRRKAEEERRRREEEERRRQTEEERRLQEEEDHRRKIEEERRRQEEEERRRRAEEERRQQEERKAIENKQMYDKAVEQMNSAVGLYKIEEAIKLFTQLGNYQDSKKKLSECYIKRDSIIEDRNQKAEKRRKEKEAEIEQLREEASGNIQINDTIKQEKDMSPGEKKEAQKTYDEGVKYFSGSTDPEVQKKAVPYILKAAKSGLAIAQCQLGSMYGNGQAVEKDIEKSIYWTQLAADQEYPMAEANLAAHYYSGEGVKQDKEKALELYKLSALHGDEFSQWAVGRMYENGEGTRKNKATARKYYLMAISNGSLDAFQSIVADGANDKKGRNECFNIVKEEFDAFFSMIKKKIPVGDTLVPQGVFNPAIEAKRNGEYIKANRIYMMLTLKYNTLPSNIAIAWIKVLGALGNTKDLLRLGHYMLYSDAPHENEYSWMMMEAYIETIEDLIRQSDISSLRDKLAAMAGEDTLSEDEIDIASAIKKKQEMPQVNATQPLQPTFGPSPVETDLADTSTSVAIGTADSESLEKIGTFHTKVVGVTFKNDDGSDRQRIIRDLVRNDKLSEGVELQFVPQPTNPYDSNCILVQTFDGQTLGTISRDLAAKIAPQIKAGIVYRPFVSSQTGGDVGYAYGINIRVDQYQKSSASKKENKYNSEELKEQCEEAKNMIRAKSYSEGYAMYKRLATTGYPEAQYGLASCYDYGFGVSADKHEATLWYEKAAIQGHAAAQADLGYNYANGEGTNVDYSKALYWYQKAAAQKNPRGMVGIGQLYEQGHGVPQSAENAHNWYEQAAELGDLDGMSNTGIDYLIGRGTARDSIKAAYWNRKAAEQGHSKAQYNLAEQIRLGDGVEQDFQEAIHWFVQAAQNGHPGAIDFCQRAGIL